MRFFGRLMETTAAASKSSKSKSICTAFWSLRFGDRIALLNEARPYSTETSGVGPRDQQSGQSA